MPSMETITIPGQLKPTPSELAMWLQWPSLQEDLGQVTFFNGANEGFLFVLLCSDGSLVHRMLSITLDYEKEFEGYPARCMDL